MKCPICRKRKLRLGELANGHGYAYECPQCSICIPGATKREAKDQAKTVCQMLDIFEKDKK